MPAERFSSKLLTEFKRQVYDIVSRIPKGFVASYSQIAEAVGSKNYARAVGNALHNNPFPHEKVPCHRVVKANGEIGGYAHGRDVKMNMLVEEGVEIVKGKVNLKKHLININLLKE